MWIPVHAVRVENSFVTLVCLVNIRQKRFSENYLPYFSLLSLPKLKSQQRIKLLL